MSTGSRPQQGPPEPDAGPGHRRTGLAGAGAWPPADPGPPGRLRSRPATEALLADWLDAFAVEAAERIGSAVDLAADLISYGGGRLLLGGAAAGEPAWDAALHLAPYRTTVTRRRSPTPPTSRWRWLHPDPPGRGTVTDQHPLHAAGTPPQRLRHRADASRQPCRPRGPRAGDGASGKAHGVLGAASGLVHEVVMITDKNRSTAGAAGSAYQLVGERAVLRFGPVTGPIPRATRPAPMPRLPTGPLPRLPRLRR